MLMITNIETGDVIALGPNCIPAWGAAIGATFAAALEHDDTPPAEAPGGEAPEGVSDGISPNHPATYPPAHEDPDQDPHAPAETGPSSPSDVPVPTDPDIDPEHPHAPAITGPGTYEEEGGAAAPPPPADPTGPDVSPAPAEAPEGAPVEQLAPSPAYV